MRLIDYKEELREETRLAYEIDDILFKKASNDQSLTTAERKTVKLVAMVMQTHQSIVDHMEELSQPQGIDKDRLEHAIKLLEFCKQRHIDIATDLPDTAFIEAQKVSCYEMALKVMRALLPQPTTDVPDTNVGEIEQPTTDGWISCSVAVPANAVPDECDDILIKRVTGEIIKGWYWSRSGRWWTKENRIGHEVRDAIAWMPYKESE